MQISIDGDQGFVLTDLFTGVHLKVKSPPGEKTPPDALDQIIVCQRDGKLFVRLTADGGTNWTEWYSLQDCRPWLCG